MNNFSNFVPNKFVNFNEKDLPWISEYLNSKFKYSSKLYAEI